MGALAIALLGACAPDAHRPDAAPPPSAVVVLVPRTPYIATFPCGSQCHDAREPNLTRRELTVFHVGRHIEHGPANQWCSDCHAVDSSDRLRTIDGTLITFDESDQLCGQCHGEKHRDWSRGIHGLQTGGWTGVAERRLCTACHDPHTPGRIHFESLPPPVPDPRSARPEP
jgi:hypothetical protein